MPAVRERTRIRPSSVGGSGAGVKTEVMDLCGAMVTGLNELSRYGRGWGELYEIEIHNEMGEEQGVGVQI